ncbi:YtxH domain-containing protein [Streptococcus sp. DD12]|uniref:YtxH domain-containing protein n=1 Tax=Streptococcus sp. DD12 TaxID=1777880 RepID=UPI00079613A4|nr:YtxH domain-containing protein [Streptococcus sp. DD12]KXT75740.1 putative general stress protein [Streptococcus sp. DD12]
MGNILKIATIGAISGACAAYFLSTEKGKEVSAKAKRAFDAYQEDPQAYHDAWAEKATDIVDLVKDTASFYYHQAVSEDLAQVLQDKAKETQAKAKDVFSQAHRTKEDVAQVINQHKDQVVTDVVVEDIIIDLPESIRQED